MKIRLPLFLAVLLLPLSAIAQTLQPFTYPTLPSIWINDVKTYAWVWDSATWQSLPRNSARILDRPSGQRDKQLVGTLVIDGNHAVPAVSGSGVMLAFRKSGEFKRFKGLPDNESGIEITRLASEPRGNRKDKLTRKAQLFRMGEAAATFGDKREAITVAKITRHDGVFHVVRVETPLAPGRYALYLPDQAFEFEVK